MQLQRLGLVIASIKHGEVTKTQPLRHAVGENLGGNALHLRFLCRRDNHAQLITHTQLAPQLLLVQVRVVRDERVGRRQNIVVGTVILFQLDEFEAGIILLKLDHVLGFGTTPGIDRLVVVAHHGQSAARAHQQFHQQILACVGVLIFVHQQVVDAVLPALQHVSVGLEKHDRQQNQIVKIHGIEGRKMPLILRVDARREHFLRLGRQQVRLVWHHQLVLPVRDGALQKLELLVTQFRILVQ